MEYQKWKLRNFDLETNESRYGDVLFLPQDDKEWIRLLRNSINLFRFKLNEQRKRSQDQANGLCDYFDPFSTPFMIETSSLVYRIELIDILLQNCVIEKKACEKTLHQKQLDDFDELQYEEAWRQMRILLKIREAERPSDKKHKPLKVGKAVLRSLLAGEDFKYVGCKNPYEKYILNSDYLNIEFN